MDAFLKDVRYGARMLAKSPAFTAVGALVLALGIGANSAIFSVVDGILWKPLPIPELDRLVLMGQRASDGTRDEMSPANYLDVAAEVKTLEHVAAWEWTSLNLTGAGEPERVQGFRVTPSLFRALDVAPLAGRVFASEEAEAGRDRVVILSHGLWERRFASDPSLIGRTVQLHARDYTVIGVMPHHFAFPPSADLWVPLVFSPQERERRGVQYVLALAKLKAGVTLREARAEVTTIGQRLEREYPDSNRNRGVIIEPFRENLQGDYTSRFSMLLLGAVGFVLLIACANVAGLGVARAAGRQREIAVRAALGASRARILRMVLVENVILALGSALLGILFALWGIDVILAYMPPEVAKYLAGWKYIGLDRRVLLFTIVAALTSGVLSAITPCIQVLRADVNDTLKEGGRSGSGGRGRHRLRQALVVTEVALSAILLIGAGLLVRGFASLARSESAHRPETLLTMRMALTDTRYREDSQVVAFYDQLLDRLQNVAGASAFGAVTYMPHGQSRTSWSFLLEGQQPLPPGVQQVAQTQSISPGYFHAMQIPILEGRSISAADGPNSPRVVVVSNAFVRRYLPNERPIGKRLRAGSGDLFEIVGVTGDIRHDSMEKIPRPVVYRSYRQVPTRRMDLVFRAQGKPEDLIAAARAQVYAIDRDQPVYDIKTLGKVISEERTGISYVTVIMAVLGVIALVLSAVGVYGVMAHSVSERTHEVGVRMALGAHRRDVLKMVLGRGMILTGIGLIVGLAGGYALARLLAGLIFGVQAGDPLSFGSATLVLLLVALAACYLPARRAARVDPMVALRYE